ncbi:MAG: hypothetical protein R2824_21855 [Saprospiraceae bacterium]
MLDIFIPVCINNEVEVTTLFDTGSGYGGMILNPYYLSKLLTDSSAVKPSVHYAIISPIVGRTDSWNWHRWMCAMTMHR